MVITATELKSNLGHYLSLAETEDVLVSKNGKPIARITAPYADRAAAMKSLFGILPADITLADVRDARLETQWKR